jgi:OmpA-OmpF porin, OOP family
MKIPPLVHFSVKHIINVSVSLFFYLILISPSWAQKETVIDNSISSSKMKARAKHALELGDPYTALFYYQEVVKKDSQDLDNTMQLADLYRITRNYKEAEKTYSYIRSSEPAKYPFSLYYKALMQKMTGQYQDAKENFILFQKESSNLADKNLKLQLPKEIAGCDSGIVYQEFPDNIVVKNAGKSVNQPHTEFSPLYVDEENMLFGSLRMDSLAYFDTHQEHYEKKPVRQVYKAKKVNGEWKEQGKYEAFNDPTMDMGNFSYSPNTNRYYFSKCAKDNQEQVSCKLYYIEKIKGKWSKPELLPDPINIEGYTSTQPTVMVDTTTSTPTLDSAAVQTQKTQNKKQPVKKGSNTNTSSKTEYLYFVSDRPEGKGGMDIWYTYYNSSKKTWAKPINFAVANTSETECTPFFHIPTQVLYFSSNGQVNAGGLDVFKMQKDGRKFLKPQNLSFPINSPQDELGFALNADGKRGFIVSNRPGGTPYFHETCCDDIFAFEIRPPKAFDCKLDLTVVKKDTTTCAGKWLKMHTYDLKTKKESFDTIKLSDCTLEMPLDKNKRYAFTLDIPGYEKDSLVLETREMSSSDKISKNLVMKAIEPKKVEDIVVNEKPNEGEAFVLKDIQYESNKTELTEDAKAVLDSVLVPFLNLHPKDKILITSHTDDVGTHEYNIHLSKQRAHNVLKYLASKGISHQRMTAEGFGETKPIAPNLNQDGSPNMIGKSINRRTEFLIQKSQ